MSPFREASLTALREIRRNLGSTKGIAMFVLFVLGGSVPSLLELAAVKLLGRDPTQGMSPDDQRMLLEQGLARVYPEETAKHLSYCPPILFLLFQLTLFFAPFFVLLIGFDQIAGDIQHRAIRYIAGRSRRESIVVGKALGVWAVISVMLLVLHITVWIVVAATGTTTAAALLSWGPRIWLFSVAACASFAGLTGLISSFFRTPIVALLVGVVVFVALWIIAKIFGWIEATKVAAWALPFKYEDLVVSHQPLRVLGGIGAYIGWGAVMTAAASLVVKRRDI
ncbi:MAG: ABC transporter permease subunit [Polyangiaceae bacterium]|nr:ABC transporter permease subunit [Polyangiaceae bacterium]